ncbi:beta-propeller fold lactonase family protein [Sodalis-like secondary symbiont of Drepanosiphum platanoidis]|uniref:beta-propeller fold lactonase family protein n=1 Tax=Sodalis-like secondary symbiont of Drepanosiphum platanoidis TaxID=2994493 RepID=UPI003464BBD0
MNQLIYISNSKSKNISVWNINKYGRLNLLQNVITPGICQPIAINEKKKILYVGIRPNFSIVNYLIKKNGFLKQIKITKLPGCSVYISLDLKNKYLFSSSYHSNNLSIHPINSKGLIENKIQLINNLNKCHCSTLDLKQKILWVSCLGSDCIKHFYLNKLKIFTLIPSMQINSSIGSGPRHIIFHLSGKYAYVINELKGTIDVIKIYNSKKISKIVQSISIFKKKYNNIKWASDIHITSNNKWIYCSERYTNSIIHFNVSKNGSFLKKIYSYKCENQPRSFLIDKTNNFLLIIGQKSNYVQVMSINKYNGFLKKISRYYTGECPSWISCINIKI